MIPSTSRTPRFFAVSDVAELLKVSTKTVRRWINDGKLHGHSFGRQYRIAEEDFRLFLATSRR